MTVFMHTQPPSLRSRAARGVNAHGLGAAGLSRVCATCTEALFISRPVTLCSAVSPE